VLALPGCLPGSDVEDARVARVDRQRADRQAVLAIEDRREQSALEVEIIVEHSVFVLARSELPGLDSGAIPGG
jgi:hypothetical protein